MCDIEKDEIEVKLSYYYIGHFSRFVKKGAKRIVVSRFTDKLEVTGFINPDGERVIVVLNKTDNVCVFKLCEGEKVCDLESQPHSIMTMLY
jgi:glucosylceramidase